MSFHRCLPLVIASLAFALNSTPVEAQTTKTFVVTSAAAGDAKTPGTLTWAVYQANYLGGDINYINFNIPGSAGAEIEIALNETLYVARPMIINAATQPGYSDKPLIRINCNRLNSGFCLVANVAGVPPLTGGLPSNGGGSTIRGFRIFNYSSNAITVLKGADSNTIADNHIGFAPLGTPGTYFRNTSVAPECRGLGLESNGNLIRGNTISGVHNAITLGFDIGAVSTLKCTNNRIEHNFIGTDPTGRAKIGNDSDGVFLGAGCEDNLIGPGNVLSGNASAGVELLHFTATRNRIFGNRIGVNARGDEVIPNGELGILLANGSSGNVVGGPYGDPEAANVISGNNLGAIAIGTAEFPGPNGSNNNRIEGNLIGSNAAGTAALGTQTSGVVVQNNSKGNIVRKNVIVGQLHHGVVFTNGAANNAMYGNWIGVTDRGAILGNGGFGAYLFDASNNTVQPPASGAGIETERNIFGVATHGPVGLYGASLSNVIHLAARPLNISTRMRVETGDNALIAGFIVTGISPKTVLIRGLGPSLGVAGALADPVLELNTTPLPIVNDDWRSIQELAIVASTIPPKSELEPAIVATLQPGAYTVTMRGKGDTSGVGLVEVYELDASGSAALANISTRGIVASGDDAMIAGFIIGGVDAQGRVAVRALGPSLAAAGITNALPNPTLQLIDSNGVLVQRCDNWQEDAAQAALLTSLNLAPSGEAESAIVSTLAPGAYTAVVSDNAGRSGTALVEVYNLP